MSLFNKIQQKTFGRSLDNIEWIDDTGYTMIWRFPCYKYKIQNGAQLKVNESQVAVLVNEGCFADVYKPGYYKLQTSNMPILTILKRWKYDFNSPFKADIYFVNTKHFMNIRWGTLSPILMYDREFGPFVCAHLDHTALEFKAILSYLFVISLAHTRVLQMIALRNS